jgi:hypothetical protein
MTPESLGSIGDSADEPESLELPVDGSGSLGAIGANHTWGVGSLHSPEVGHLNSWLGQFRSPS